MRLGLCEDDLGEPAQVEDTLLNVLLDELLGDLPAATAPTLGPLITLSMARSKTTLAASSALELPFRRRPSRHPSA